MKRIASIFTLIFLLWGHPVLAEESPAFDFAAPQKARCAEMCSVGLSICMAEEYKASDARLAELYKELSGGLRAPNPLQRGQLAWLKYRDAQCQLAASALQPKSSEHYYALNACLIDLTEKRFLELENISRTASAGTAESR